MVILIICYISVLQRNDPVIVQELNLDLVQLKLSRIVFISNAYKIRSEKILLKPITFDLTTKWNLSSSWYTEIPDFDVDAKLGAITVGKNTFILILLLYLNTF